MINAVLQDLLSISHRSCVNIPIPPQNVFKLRRELSNDHFIIYIKTA